LPKRTKNKSAKEVVLPHSQAKLELFQTYLKHYYRILSLSPVITAINLYDIFCGAGIYKDGKKGSPLLTLDAIKEINKQISLMGKPLKPTFLKLNDGDFKRIKSVEELLTSETVPNLKIEYTHKTADVMLEDVIKDVNSKGNQERNLVFIDPYGYSEVRKERISELLENGHSEIVLFLPIMQMHRFSEIALNDELERKCFENLKRFIHEFFTKDHRIFTEKLNNAIEFIYELKDALTFGSKYYTCSYYIERGKGNYYAVFFITSNLLGLEKMIEAKQKLDPNRGKGYDKKNLAIRNSLFADQIQEEDRHKALEYLKEILLKELREKINGLTNCDIYYLTVTNEFLPTNANSVLKELIKEQKVLPYYGIDQNLSSGAGYYINFDHYKKKDIKVTFKSKIHGTIKH